MSRSRSPKNGQHQKNAVESNLSRIKPSAKDLEKYYRWYPGDIYLLLDMTDMCVLRFFLPRGGTCHPLVDSSRTYPEARHALPGAVFHMSKMRAHVAADARVTSGTLYL